MKGPKIQLVEISRANLGAVLKLDVRPEQRQFVASNAYSLACAPYYPACWFRAIYADDQPVGFLMTREVPETGEYLLLRLMIDARHQGKRYGWEAMRLLIDRVRGLPNARELLTSHEPLEGAAGPFYEKLGFSYTGAVDEDGELMMSLPLSPA